MPGYEEEGQEEGVKMAKVAAIRVRAETSRVRGLCDTCEDFPAGARPAGG